MSPVRTREPAPPASGEPCCDEHHDRLYLPAGATANNPASWLCSHGDHPSPGWHFRAESCPPAPPLSEAKSQRIIFHDLAM